MTLDQLSPGQRGRILRIDGVDSVSSRLREMGFIAGEWVEYVCRAPFYGPVKCGVAESRIAVRQGEAKRVQVELVA
jgi:Fe2+ transport system protein FeoA